MRQKPTVVEPRSRLNVIYLLSTKKHLHLEYKEVVNPYLGTMPTSAHPLSACTEICI